MNPQVQVPKLAALLAHAETMRRKAVFATKMTALAYAILVVFVFAYTNLVIIKLNQVATPDNLSALIKGQVEQLLPDVRKLGVSKAKEYTPLLADQLATLPAELMPTVEELVKNTIDQQIDNVIVAVKADLLPRLVEILEANAETINLTAETIKDQSAASGMALLLVEELDKLFNDQFHHACSKLRDQLDLIREKPISQLNKMELVERNLLVNWVFLTEHGDVNSAYGNVVEKLGHAYEFLANTFKKNVEQGGDDSGD